MLKHKIITKKILSWALYDWANSAFALSVLAVIFPLALGSYWNTDHVGATSTFNLGWVTFSSSLIVFLLAPILGVIADKGGYKKRFLFIFSMIGALATIALGFISQDDWFLALGFYLIASVGFYSSTIFYDSLLMNVTKPKYFNFVSNFGYSLGYLGGAILLSLHLWMLKSPHTFGFISTKEVFSYAFISVGIWWMVFLLPAIFYISEPHTLKGSENNPIRDAFKKLRSTIKKIRNYRNIAVFLIAYWLYIGGVSTVIFMAVNYGQRLGFKDSDLVFALLISNFIGFPATFLYGFFTHYLGAKKGLYLALIAYIGVCLWAIQMTEMREFYILSFIIGLFQGASQGLSRSIYATLIPTDHSSEFFGFYSMVTKFANVIGPALVAIAATISNDPKWVLLSLIPMFVIGSILLSFVEVSNKHSN